jgi:hypothetical protein
MESASVDSATVISLLTLIATLIGLAAGFYSMKRGMIDSSNRTESRLTRIETDLRWIKRVIPKRSSDVYIDDPEG